MVGEVVQNLHVDVHAHPGGDGDEQGSTGITVSSALSCSMSLSVSAAEVQTKVVESTSGSAPTWSEPESCKPNICMSGPLTMGKMGRDADRVASKRGPPLPCGAVAADLIRLHFRPGVRRWSRRPG